MNLQTPKLTVNFHDSIAESNVEELSQLLLTFSREEICTVWLLVLGETSVCSRRHLILFRALVLSWSSLCGTGPKLFVCWRHICERCVSCNLYLHVCSNYVWCTVIFLMHSVACPVGALFLVNWCSVLWCAQWSIKIRFEWIAAVVMPK